MHRLGDLALLRLGAPALGLVAMLTAGVPGAAVAQGARPEPVIVELQLGRIAGRTVDAYRLGDVALLPLRAFTEMAELRLVTYNDGSVETLVQPGNLPLVLDPASRTYRLGGDKKSLADDDLVTTPEELFLSTGFLGRVFGLEWAVSWEDLQVTALAPEGLPVARRLRRESLLRARLDGAGMQAGPAALHLGLERPRVDGMVLDYSVLTPLGEELGDGAYSGTLGLDVLGGSLAMGLQSVGGADQGVRSEFSWSGIWREQRWLTQLRVGDGYATGPRARSLRGISVSNSPYVRPATLGVLPFHGQLGPGWTVEAYRGGRLIGFDSVNALGQFSFDVPVQYGENPIDFVAYGPFGEVQEFNRTYRVQASGLPRGQFEYAASLGSCRGDRCSASGNLDLRYGVNTRWTIGAGIDRFWRDTAGSLTHPYITATGLLGNAFAVEGEAVGDAVLRGAFNVEPSVNLRLLVEGYRFARGVKDPILTPQGRENQLTLAAFFRPTNALGGAWLEASLDRINTNSGQLTSGRLGASLQVAEARLMPAIRFQRQAGGSVTSSQTYFGFNAFILPRPSLGSVLGSVSARASFEVQRGVGAVSSSAFLSRPILRGLRAEAGTTWYRGSGASLSFLLAAELPSVRSYTNVTSGPQGALGSQYISGSAIYNPSRHGVDFSGSTGLQRGGVTGRVFLDANGNGAFDAEDQPLVGVQVVVGHTATLSDSTGAYRVWDLLPFEPLRVTVDSATIPSPLWVPVFGAAMVEPSPNRYRQLDIPVVPAGVLEGRVAWVDPARRGRLPAGVTLVLTHRETGEQRALLTFSDGSFYALGIRSGPWEVTIPAECLRILGATSEPVSFTMIATMEGGSVDNLMVPLR
jgi:hypothetical protein